MAYRDLERTGLPAGADIAAFDTQARRYLLEPDDGSWDEMMRALRRAIGDGETDDLLRAIEIRVRTAKGR